jgi:hypothetical protein
MTKRTTIRASEGMTRGTVGREAQDRDPPHDRFAGGLMRSVRGGKTFLLIWTLVAAALVALSVSTIFTAGRPKGIDFDWIG